MDIENFQKLNLIINFYFSFDFLNSYVLMEWLVLIKNIKKKYEFLEFSYMRKNKVDYL